MTIPLTTIILAIIAAIGIGWSYPKIPAPWNLILVVTVALICVGILLSLTGVIHFS